MHRKRRNTFIITVVITYVTYLCFIVPSKHEKQNMETQVIPENMKAILFRIGNEFYPYQLFEHGQVSFIKNGCRFNNCYITFNNEEYNDRIFDAVVFNGRDLQGMNCDDLPKKNLSQIYIYMNYESMVYYPICQDCFDGFFNLTFSYKLDSDVAIPYYTIKEKDKIVGPKLNMHWTKYNHNDIDKITKTKSKAVAWFVSNCHSKNGREKYVEELKEELNQYNLDIHVYGDCGDIKCALGDKKCEELIKNYFFYLAFENSDAEDYVTEKVLKGINNIAVPIVYGGANYSRFLPPRSYLDAKSMSPQKLANKISNLIKSPKLYSEMFWWRSHYTFHETMDEDIVCSLCSAVNNQTSLKRNRSHENFRRWWNFSYEKYCTTHWYNIFF